MCVFFFVYFLTASLRTNWRKIPYPNMLIMQNMLLMQNDSYYQHLLMVKLQNCTEQCVSAPCERCVASTRLCSSDPGCAHTVLRTAYCRRRPLGICHGGCQGSVEGQDLRQSQHWWRGVLGDRDRQSSTSQSSYCIIQGAEKLIQWKQDTVE